jgi:putative nucleotidyltransferase with HDIG domain
MKAYLSRCYPQPLTSIVISVLALAILSLSWHGSVAAGQPASGGQEALVALFLAAMTICAGARPIHLQHSIQIAVTTIPLYVAAIMVSPPVAALVAGASIMLIQLLTRSQHGNTLSDMATATGRWVIVAFLSAWVARRGMADGWPLLVILLSVAVVMFVCDIVTGALEIAPMIGAPPRRVIPILVQESGVTEGVQYLFGVLAALAALEQPWSLVLWMFPLWLMYQYFKQLKELHESTVTLVESMADAVDLRDPYTGGHSRRVADLAVQILREMRIAGPEVRLIRSAARVHDIGKISIPDHILNKPGQLTDDERSIMDSHPERGAALLARYSDFARGVDIVRCHHEHWDGSGYPAGLAELDIPFGARVVAVADSFDAMTTDRPYRKGLSVEEAARILHAGRGLQWDPAIVDAFLRYLARQQPGERCLWLNERPPRPRAARQSHAS